MAKVKISTDKNDEGKKNTSLRLGTKTLKSLKIKAIEERSPDLHQLGILSDCRQISINFQDKALMEILCLERMVICGFRSLALLCLVLRYLYPQNNRRVFPGICSL